MDLVMSLCNPVIVMSEGRKLMEGTPQEVQRDPRVLEFVELIHLKDEYAGNLSGGQKKLLELAPTLMKTIFGLLKPRAGRIWLGERDITGLEPDQIVRLGVCYVPQTDNVFPSLTVKENLEMGAFILDEKNLDARIERVYSVFPDLKRFHNTKAGMLSGGQRQMLARAWPPSSSS